MDSCFVAKVLALPRRLVGIEQDESARGYDWLDHMEKKAFLLVAGGTRHPSSCYERCGPMEVSVLSSRCFGKASISLISLSGGCLATVFKNFPTLPLRFLFFL